MKRFLAILLAFLLPLTASAAVTFPINGGTGSSTLTGIILGAGTSPVQTLQIGNGLQLLSGILSSTGVTTFGTTSISATSPLIWNTSTANMSIQVANTSQNGYLSSTDWNTFNNKQPAGTYVTSVTGTANQITSSGSTAITLSLPNHVIFPTDYVASAGSTTNATTTNFAITGAAANCNGTSALTTTSSGVVGCTTQPQGTVTAVSVASTNGFAGTSSGGATPALTLTTSITGVLKGNGTAITAASNGTDYSLITALTCSAGQFFQQATAAGVFTCGTPTGTNYTGTFPIAVTGSVISSLFSTTSNSGMAQGFQYVGSSGIFQTAASSSLFGYTPLNPTRNVNTTAPLTGGGALTSDLTLGCASCSTFAWPFTPTSYGNATGTLIGFTGGILSIGSTTIVGNATTTGMHAFGNVRIPSLGIAAGQFAAFDPNGVLIGTTTPTNTGGSSEGVQWATAAVLGGTPTYSNGTAGVGATLTEVGTGALAVDGNAPASGDRVLVKNQASAFQNGIYTVTITGSGIASYVLTRSSDYNSNTEITPGLTTYVVSGTANLDTNWAVNFTVPLTMGTTNLNYTEVSGGGAAVTSVSNSDSTLTITPTTGNVVGSLNLAHANVWSALQTFGNASSTLFSTTYASSTNYFGANLATCTGTNALTWSGGFFGCQAQPQGTVTAVTATAPLFSSGGATPNLTWAGLATTTQPASSNVLTSNGTNGVYGTATSSVTCSSGVSCGSTSAVLGGALSITNTGVTSIVAGTNVTISGATGAVTINSTASGGGAFPFTPLTNFGVNTSATSTPIWAQLGLFASSTSQIASTTFAINGNVGISTSSPSAQLTVASKTSADQTPAFVIDGATGSFNADMQLNRGSNTGTEEANIDFATAGTVNYQLGIQNNSTSDFELWDGSNDPVFTVKNGTNNIGFGTSTPFGDFAINADYGDVLPGNIIFNVASSSLTGTTSLFNISNTGVVSHFIPISSGSLFDISTSTNLFGEIFNVSATTSVLSLLSTAVESAAADIGTRVGIGLSSYLGFGGLLDQFVVNGRINTQGWNQITCEYFNVAQTTAAGTANICPGFTASSGAASSISVNTLASGYIYLKLNDQAGSATAANALFLGGTPSAQQFLTAGTSTPVMEVSAKIDNPLNSTTTIYYIGMDSNGRNGLITTVPTDGCWFAASSTPVNGVTNGNWVAVASAANVQTISDTGVASSTSITSGGSWMRFRLEISNNSCVFYIQSSQTTSMKKVATITTNIPTAVLDPAVWLRQNGGLANALDVMRFNIWWRDFLPAI